jgi:hypothetical protein
MWCSPPLYYGGGQEQKLKLMQARATVQLDNENTNAILSSKDYINAPKSNEKSSPLLSMSDEHKNLKEYCKNLFLKNHPGWCLFIYTFRYA